MKQIKLNYLLTALAFITILASCHKDKNVLKSGPPTATRAGLYVLNQGGFGSNNSTLTYYDYTTKTLTADIFSAVNGKKLGDVGNDVGIYGSKMYIIVNNSNKIDIVNAKTGKLIKQDSLHQCRSIAFYKGNAFITSYDNEVAVMDTASLIINQYIQVGRNPEQLLVANNKLYVANSGGLDFGHPDTTVSVVDLTTLKETKRIPVTANPVSLTADSYGHVYVLSLGDFASIPGGMTIINDNTDVVLSKPTVSLGFNIPIVALGDYVYYVTADGKIAVYNAKTQTAAQANFIADGTAIATPYTLAADPLSGEIFVGDAKDYASNGTLFAFDKTGKLEYSITTGISPGKVAFINK
jgi:YVTN family beta-propeller protein